MIDHKELIDTLRDIGHQTQPSQRYVDRLKRYLMAHVRQDTSMHRGFWSFDMSLLYGKLVFGLCLFAVSFIGWRTSVFRSNTAAVPILHQPNIAKLDKSDGEQSVGNPTFDDQQVLQELSENDALFAENSSQEVVLEKHQAGVAVDEQANSNLYHELNNNQAPGVHLAPPIISESALTPSEVRGAVVADTAHDALSSVVLLDEPSQIRVPPTPTPTLSLEPPVPASDDELIQPVTIRLP